MSKATTPSVRSRLSRSPQAKARFTAAKSWLDDRARLPQNCPIQEVTDYISFNTAVRNTLLFKYDQSKLIHIYAGIPASDRKDLVEDFRKEVISREKRNVEWRRVHVLARQIDNEDGDDAEAWEALNKVSREAVENTTELRVRLTWCETRFEAGGMTAQEVAGASLREGEKVFIPDEAEVEEQEEARGRSRSRR